MIFPRGADANDKLRINNQRMNVELEKIVKQQGILFSNINNHFLTKKAELNSDIMPDYLHPHTQGCEIWAEQLAP